MSIETSDRDVTSTSAEQKYLQQSIAALQATASNFASVCITDANVRWQYMNDVHAAAIEIRLAVQNGKLTPKEAAESANKTRNQLLEFSRRRSSAVARAYAMQLKKDGLSIGKLAERYAQRLFHKPFNVLTESQQTSVYLEIINAAGRGNTAVAVFAETLGKAGRRLVLVSLAVATYEIYEAEDKPREIVRQGSLAAAGVAGGWATAGGAVATGVCAATVPVCVGVAALIGGLLFAYGAELTFNSIYPKPAFH